MKILRNLEVPTGNILIVEGERGKLECLSIGDYGKEANLKADFMGLTSPLREVKHQRLLPLTQKWVITISTQYGCSMNCTFCDVPKVGPGRNASMKDLIGQVLAGMSLHPSIQGGDRLNIHYARMGEPTWNPSVLDSAIALRYLLVDPKLNGFEELRPFINYRFHVHPVVSTMLPRENKNLLGFLQKWMHIKNDLYDGEAGLQFSINSTDAGGREFMFGGNAMSLDRVYDDIVKNLPKPKGRKITLNFAVPSHERPQFKIDPQYLAYCFDPEFYTVKLTPMHSTDKAEDCDMSPMSGGWFNCYQESEEALKKVGYEVIVFVASDEEDSSRITCGNAILSGTKPASFTEITP